MAAERLESGEKILGAAGSFTGVWALAWFGAHFGGAAAGVTGGFAVGGVMAGSGLTLLWWRMSAVRALTDAPAEEKSKAMPKEPAPARR